MAITIKSQEEIEQMRIAGKIVAETHALLEEAIRPGITTKELDQIAEQFILSKGATPSFKGYYGYPASICTSINEEVVHGIPSDRVLQEGDIISLDIGACIGGYHGDAARTHGVGQISEEVQRLIRVTRESFYEGMKWAKKGNHLYEISSAIQKYVELHGFSVVRDFVGHGIGQKMHEDPQIPNYKPKGRGPRLETGMVLAIEPMVNLGAYEVRILSNDWTVVTRDGQWSAHYENTLAITDEGYELLTILPNEQLR
ncbi:MAG: type I methionyl aminopeptidase [Epulopiscium sp.]|nr:type I methionyl aminopeptidase [Candidatus Epulonipiscium sp.]